MLAALNPARYSDNQPLFTRRLERLNAVLGLDGYQISADGKLKVVPSTRKSSAGQERARRLRAELTRRAYTPPCSLLIPELLTKHGYLAV